MAKLIKSILLSNQDDLSQQIDQAMSQFNSEMDPWVD